MKQTCSHPLDDPTRSPLGWQTVVIFASAIPQPFQTSAEQRKNALYLRKPSSVDRLANPAFPAYKVFKAIPVIPKRVRNSLPSAPPRHSIWLQVLSLARCSTISRHVSSEWDFFSDAFTALSHFHVHLFSIFNLKPGTATLAPPAPQGRAVTHWFLFPSCHDSR